MSVRSIEAEVSIKSGVQAECTIGREVIVEVHDDVNLESLTATENGTYMPGAGIDGYSSVSVAVPKDIKASGSFVATATTTNKTLDTGSTEWTRLLIVPHEVPPANSTSVRAILTKYVDLNLDAMFTAFMSNAGVAYNAGSYRKISTGEECNVENGIVSFSGEQASVGKFIKNSQYDWWAW